MSDHSKLSPSARHRWSVCPRSKLEEQKYPEQPSGPAAIDGTHTHTLFEHCQKNNVSPFTMVGQKMTDHEGDFFVDKDRAERVAVAMQYVTNRTVELGTPITVRSEIRLEPAPIVGRFDMSGTTDCLIVTDDLIEVIDYKDGISPVNAKNNLQMEQYAVGALAEYPTNKFKRIRMTIIQPKMKLKGVDPISSHEVDVEEFKRDVISKIIAEAAATDDPDAPFNPGDEQCKYCRAKGGCTALFNQSMSKAGITFDIAVQSANTEPSELSDEKIREIVEAAPMIRQMLEGVEAEAQRRLESGKTIKGLKLVRGNGSRAWAFSEDEMVEKLKKFGLPKDVIWQTKLISVAQAEKAAWTKKDGTEVKLSDRQLKMMAEYVTKNEGKLTVALEADKRPAIIKDVSAMFELPSWMK